VHRDTINGTLVLSPKENLTCGSRNLEFHNSAFLYILPQLQYNGDQTCFHEGYDGDRNEYKFSVGKPAGKDRWESLLLAY
jgi:hypothetical protein